MSKIALCVIAKNEEANIGRMLQSVDGHVDHVFLLDTGSTDRTIEVAKEALRKTDITVEQREIKQEELGGGFNFGEARHQSFQMAKGYEWILWLDCDDVLQGGELLREMVEKLEANGANELWVNYNYEYNSIGQVALTHKRRSLVKASDWEWESGYYATRGIRYPIHENLYCNTEEIGIMTEEIYIDHLKSKDGFGQASDRNLEILYALLKFEGDNPDPRTIFLIGRQTFDKYIHKPEARTATATINFLEKYIAGEFAPHDHLESCKMLCDVYRSMGDWDAEKRVALEMMAVNPHKADPYIFYAQVLRNEGRYADALAQIEIALTKAPTGLETESISRTDLLRNMTFVAAESHACLGEYDEAMEWLEEYIPHMEREHAEAILGEYEKYRARREFKKTISSLEGIIYAIKAFWKDKNEQQKRIQALINLFPPKVIGSKEITNIRKRELPRRERLDKSIDIFCVANFEEWDYDTVMAKGSGGSETAVVELAKRFADAGYTVTVWNKPPLERNIGGVWYRDVDKIDFTDKFDIFISWRNASIFKDLDIDANKKYLWLQDIMDPFDYPRQVWTQLDKIIVLSKYHRGWLPFVPEDKFFYTTNGINTALIEDIEAEGIDRDGKKVLYCSSADRGLEQLIFKIWPEVIKEIPDAQLYWYYGWNSFQGFLGNIDSMEDGAAKDHAMARRDWKERMDKQMESLGVHNMGRASKDELYRAMFSAGTLAYPLSGPAETSCIVLMEAQATGMLPITTGITALEETQQFGIKEPDIDLYTKKLIDALKKDPATYPNKEQIEWAREYFNWDRVAKTWVNELL